MADYDDYDYDDDDDDDYEDYDYNYYDDDDDYDYSLNYFGRVDDVEDVYVPTRIDRIKAFFVGIWYRYIYWKLNKIFKWSKEMDDIPF